MAGFPQLREAARLYSPDDALVPLVLVRLLERMDGSGWDLYVHDPASGPAQHARYPDEAQARAELARVYEWGRVDGEWQVNRREGYRLAE